MVTRLTPQLNKTCGDRVWSKQNNGFNHYAGRRENTVVSCLKDPVSPPLGIEGLIQLVLTVRDWRYTTKSVGVLNDLFLGCLETAKARVRYLFLGAGSWS